MPLRSGHSQKAIGENIRLLMREGRPRPQAVAISLRTAGIERKETKMAKKSSKKKSAKSKKRPRKTPKWSASLRAAFKREKRAMINKYNKKARG